MGMQVLAAPPCFGLEYCKLLCADDLGGSAELQVVFWLSDSGLYSVKTMHGTFTCQLFENKHLQTPFFVTPFLFWTCYFFFYFVLI